jgi:hypothetical protein
MQFSSIFAVLVLGAVVASTGACSSSDDAPADDRVALRGAYVPTSESSTAAISLLYVESDARYHLRTRECADESCEERGSYSFGAERHSLELVVDGTGRHYTLPFDIVASRHVQAGEATPASVKPRFTPADTSGTTPADGTNDGDKGVLTSGDAELAAGDAELVKEAVSLVASLVTLNGESYASLEGPGKKAACLNNGKPVVETIVTDTRAECSPAALPANKWTSYCHDNCKSRGLTASRSPVFKPAQGENENECVITYNCK